MVLPKSLKDIARAKYFNYKINEIIIKYSAFVGCLKLTEIVIKSDIDLFTFINHGFKFCYLNNDDSVTLTKEIIPNLEDSIKTLKRFNLSKQLKTPKLLKECFLKELNEVQQVNNLIHEGEELIEKGFLCEYLCRKWKEHVILFFEKNSIDYIQKTIEFIKGKRTILPINCLIIIKKFFPKYYKKTKFVNSLDTDFNLIQSENYQLKSGFDLLL